MALSRALYEVKDGVGAITLNRPAVLNALDTDLAIELADAAERAAKDHDVWVVVVKGAGRAFSSGMDRTALSAGRPCSRRAWVRRSRALLAARWAFCRASPSATTTLSSSEASSTMMISTAAIPCWITESMARGRNPAALKQGMMIEMGGRSMDQLWNVGSRRYLNRRRTSIADYLARLDARR